MEDSGESLIYTKDLHGVCSYSYILIFVYKYYNVSIIFIIIVDAHSCDEEKGLYGTMALEPEPGEKGAGCLAALCHAEKEKEGEVQPSYGKTQEKVDHCWSEAVDKGKFIYNQNAPFF